MYSIVEVSGKQIWLEVGRIYTTNRIALKPGSQLNFTRILLTNEKDTTNGTNSLKIGTPYIKQLESKVNAIVLNHFKAKKVMVFKMKRKKKKGR